MEKVERYIYIVLIIILVGVIASGTTYIIMKNNDKTEIKENINDKTNNNEVDNEKEPIKQDGVKLVKTYNLNDKIVEEFEITLNGKSNNLKIEYYSEKKEESEFFYYQTIGKIETKEVYHIESNNKDFTINIIKNKFNENNFKIIKGTDNKNYLLLTTDSNAYLNTSELLVFNDNMELISKNIIPEKESPDLETHDGFVINTYDGNSPCEYENNIDPKYPMSFKHFSEYNPKEEFTQLVKIEDNKIYFLYPKLNFSEYNILKENDYGVLEERVYTINNNKLNYKVINTYKITSVCQQI